jgi:hypothetical protein
VVFFFAPGWLCSWFPSLLLLPLSYYQQGLLDWYFRVKKKNLNFIGQDWNQLVTLPMTTTTKIIHFAGPPNNKPLTAPFERPQHLKGGGEYVLNYRQWAVCLESYHKSLNSRGSLLERVDRVTVISDPRLLIPPRHSRVGVCGVLFEQPGS